ncbi:hypothetical protein QA583_07155 [Mycolicibacterium fortuitum]|nr:hypothetical protein [Mycolicibacterium fortuitum]
MDAPHPRPTTRALEPAPLSSPGERIRFVLRAQMRAAGVNQSKIAASLNNRNDEHNSQIAGKRGLIPEKMGKSGLSYWLTTGDLTSDDLRFVRLVERYGVHNSATSRYAQRILDSSELDRRGDSEWWTNEFSKMTSYNRPIEVIVAGLSLYQYVIERGDDIISNNDDLSPTAVRNLAFALCRVGSSSMGYAGEALTTIARLGAVVSEHVAEFIVVSPLGLWLGRAADGALRREPTGRTAGDSRRLIADYTRVALDLRQDISPDIPAACTGHLRLLRRVALDNENENSLHAANTLIAIARNATLSPRWRRFALWVSCEPAIRQPNVFRSKFEESLSDLRDDPVLADVVGQLVGKTAKTPAYRKWGGDSPSTFDAFLQDNRGGLPGVFTWPLHSYPATDEVLSRYTLRNYDEHRQSSITNVDNLAHVGPDIRLRLLDALHEAIIHPGIVRIQAAIDMFRAAGPDVIDAVVQTIWLILKRGGVLKYPTEHHPALIESCLEILGGMRHHRSLPLLLEAARPEFGQFIHARAIWAIGDVLSCPGNGWYTDHHDSIKQVLHDGLMDISRSVRRATLHTIAVAKLRDFEDVIAPLTSDTSDVRDWARWCFACWKGDEFINVPPNFM